MAELSSVGYDLSQPAVQLEDGSEFMLATPYLEDYLNKFFTDLQAINSEASGALTGVENIGAGEGVFAQLDGQEIELKSLVAGAGITVSADADEITIASASGASIAPGTEESTLTVWDNTAMEWVELPEVKLAWVAGVATLTIEDSLGSDVTAITMDGDGQLGLFFDNTQVANTRAAGNGGLFVNNTATGAGFERVLTTSDAAAVADGTVEDSILHWNDVAGEWQPLDELTLNVAANVLTVSVEDSGAVLQPVLTADADDFVNIHYGTDGAIRARSVNAGWAIRSTADNNPASGGANNAELRFENPSDERSARVGYQGTTTEFEVKNEIHGGTILLSAEDTGGAEQSLVTGDPDGDVALYYDSDPALASGQFGMEVYGIGADSDPAIRMLDNPGGTLVGNIRATSGSGLVIDNRRNGLVQVRATDASASVVPMATFDPDDAVVLYFDDEPAMATFIDGIEVFNTEGAGQSGLIDLYDGGLSNRVQLVVNGGTGNGTFRSRVNSAHMFIISTDAGGTLVDGLEVDPDGQTIISHSGDPVIRTSAGGIRVLDTSGDDPTVLFADDANSGLGRMGYLGSTQLIFSNEQHGGHVAVLAEDTGGTTQTGLEFDPDTGVAVNGGTPTAPPTYSVTNVSTDRAYDANSTTLDEIADVLGTLIADLTLVGWLA